MASRIMHYCIAKKILETIQIDNPNEFHIGNLAPDLSRLGNGNYEKAHFGYSVESLKGINYQKYLDKYYDGKTFSDYKYGYFVHLLTDAIWLKEIQDRHIRSQENKERLYDLGYKDMYMLNPILIEKFKLEKFNFIEIRNEIDEVDLTWFIEISKSLNDDFSIKSIGTETQVYPLNSVINFIEESANKCSIAINQLRSGVEIINPTVYYVEK